MALQIRRNKTGCRSYGVSILRAKNSRSNKTLREEEPSDEWLYSPLVTSVMMMMATSSVSQGNYLCVDRAHFPTRMESD